jgi:hypothetical protein
VNTLSHLIGELISSISGLIAVVQLLGGGGGAFNVIVDCRSVGEFKIDITCHFFNGNTKAFT